MALHEHESEGRELGSIVPPHEGAPASVPTSAPADPWSPMAAPGGLPQGLERVNVQGAQPVLPEPISASALDEVNMSLWEKSPVGAIGLILQNFGAGLRGESVLPSDRYLEAQFKGSIARAQQVSSALAIGKEIGAMLQLQDPQQQVATLSRLRAAGVPALGIDMAAMAARRPGPFQQFKLESEASAAFKNAASYLKAHAVRMIETDPRSKDPNWKQAAQNRVATDLQTSAGTPQKLKEIIAAYGPAMGLTPQHFQVMTPEWTERTLVAIGAVEDPDQRKARMGALGKAQGERGGRGLEEILGGAAEQYEKGGQAWGNAWLVAATGNPDLAERLGASFQSKDESVRFKSAVESVREYLDKGQDAGAIARGWPGISDPQRRELQALASVGPQQWAKLRGAGEGLMKEGKAQVVLDFLEARGITPATVAALGLNIPDEIAKQAVSDTKKMRGILIEAKESAIQAVYTLENKLLPKITPSTVGVAGWFNANLRGYINQLTESGQRYLPRGQAGLEQIWNHLISQPQASTLLEGEARDYARTALSFIYEYATGNKRADRVAVWDLQRAEKALGLLSLGASAGGLQQAMTKLKGEMRADIDQIDKRLQALGGVALPGGTQSAGPDKPVGPAGVLDYTLETDAAGDTWLVYSNGVRIKKSF